MRFDRDKVLRKASGLDAEELLDRVTVLREEMEGEAIDIFTAELARRGIGPDEIHAHERGIKHRVVRGETDRPSRAAGASGRRPRAESTGTAFGASCRCSKGGSTTATGTRGDEPPGLPPAC